ncbi:MAG: histidinol dehydrogenase [Thermoprotei archaeon]|mgnify:CR=1 FL=1|nr:MAG: histidinol dehydrogenase [Thermoprotei archaeon]
MAVLTPKKLAELSSEEFSRIMARSSLDIESIKPKVEEIINRVRKYGDEEIVRFYESFFGERVLDKESIKVSESEFEEAYSVVPEDFIDAIKVAVKNVEKFHREQLPRRLWITEVCEGVYAGQFWNPIESVGAYIPGGRAAYPSTVLMTTIPAKVAGVEKIIACTPPRPDGSVHPVTLATLGIVGVEDVFKVGGAHAIAAMAFGTQTIPKVEKVVGPGNIWVVTAKKLLYGIIDIDFIAGPSEVLIIADDSANPYYVAIDMVAQAEHDPLAAAVLVTTSPRLAKEVSELLDDLVKSSPRGKIIEESLKRNGAIIVVNDLKEAFNFANKYAPEHLEIIVKKISLAEIAEVIKNAGSVFIGPNTPVALGDYVIGTNHVLPTNMFAKKRGGLSVLDFIKITDVQYVTYEGIAKLGPCAVKIAEEEGLVEHANSVKARLKHIPISSIEK